MTAVPFNPFVTYTDSSGNPLVGGKIYTYTAGTSSLKDSYTDATASTPATNPVVLDAYGRSPYGAIWLSGSYKLVLADSTGSVIQTDDNITAAFGSGDMTKAVYDPANIGEQVLGKTAIQDVSNKSFQDSTTYFVDNSDSTKKIQFQVSGVTTGTTRTFTWPDSDGTVALTAGGSAISQLEPQVFTSSGTYTPTSGMKYCIVEVVGGGGGSYAGSSAGDGGNSSFGTILTANGGAGGGINSGSSGGTATGGDINIAGGNSSGSSSTFSGLGGEPAFYGKRFSVLATAGSGYGYGVGGNGPTSATAWSGGAGGGYCRKVISAAAVGASQTVTIGAAGSAGGAGGAAGKAGIVVITEFI